MLCPFCQKSNTAVVDTRSHPEEAGVRRRRQCPSCQMRFSTQENVEWNLPQVEKRDGRIEKFDRIKVQIGVINAVKKRNIPFPTIQRFLNEVEHAISAMKLKTVRSVDIGNLILKKLFRFDQVAALRFASVYMRFENLDSFKELIDEISDLPSPEARAVQYRLMDENFS